eukprot:GAHX01001762.1.p1 GENE.GAHX01001762.1~~GAHX01001762.1.p1  ORF type:complete len:417 (-),score=52.93 GAHX01001762.1:704-1954(-)
MMLISSNSNAILIRPRRFGKTITLNFLQLIFQGRSSKKYFKGTYIYDQPFINGYGQHLDKNGDIIKDEGITGTQKRAIYQWPKHPVIYFNFKSIADQDFKIARYRIIQAIYRVAEQYGIKDRLEDPNSVIDMVTYFTQLINCLTKLGNGYKQSIVVLIDEFDAVFRDARFNTTKQQDDMKKLMSSFYNVLQSESRHIKLKLITGITTIYYTEILTPYSDITNISLWPQYSTIVGFTKQELEKSLCYNMFEKLAKNIARYENIELPNTKEELIKLVMNKLEKGHNGYRFSQAETTVYNTYFVIISFTKKIIENRGMHGFSSEIQYKEIRNNPSIFKEITEDKEIDNMTEDDLFAVTSMETDKKMRAIDLLYQTGLLTIKNSYLEKGKLFHSLHFPNKEIKDNLKKMVTMNTNRNLVI